MIEPTDTMPLLVGACPSFKGKWQEHLDDLGNDAPYAAAGKFARHLLECHQRGDTAAFEAVGNAIERLLVEGTPWVQEFATIGVLEGIQNIWGHSTTSPEAFFPFLGPESQRRWQDLNRFWAGEAQAGASPDSSQ